MFHFFPFRLRELSRAGERHRKNSELRAFFRSPPFGGFPCFFTGFERKGPFLMSRMQQEYLSGSLARQVFFQSFYFSQGYAPLHKSLFAAIVARRPTWKYSFALEKELKKHAQGSIHRLVANGFHKYASDRDIESEVQNMLDAFHEALSRGNDFTSELKVDLLRKIIVQDSTYLKQPGGRPKKEPASQTVSPHRDRWLSHTCHYILLRQKTGVAVFDEIFRVLGDHFQRDDPIYKQVVYHVWSQFNEVIRIYQEHHPWVRVPLEHPAAFVDRP